MRRHYWRDNIVRRREAVAGSRRRATVTSGGGGARLEHFLTHFIFIIIPFLGLSSENQIMFPSLKFGPISISMNSWLLIFVSLLLLLASKMVGIVYQIGILDWPGIYWLLDRKISADPPLLTKRLFHHCLWNVWLQLYKLVVSWPDNPRQLVEARGVEKNSHQWCNRLCPHACNQIFSLSLFIVILFQTHVSQNQMIN